MKRSILFLVLAICTFMAACASKPDMRNGVLVDDWYTWPDRSVSYLDVNNVVHNCKYANGVVVSFTVGRTSYLCP